MNNLNFRKPETTSTGLSTHLDPRAFCRLRFSPLLATGVLVDLLREHFGNKDSITDPMLQQCVWRDDLDTGILIESSSNEVLTHVGQRPAVLVKRNAIQKIPRLTINDEITATSGQMGRQFLIALQGSHTVFSVAVKPANAEALANEATMLLAQYAPLIKQSLCFADFELQSIDQLSVLEGSGGQYVVPSTFAYKATFEWTLDADLPPIRHVSIKTLFGL